MICKKCMMVMGITGTTYEQKKSKEGRSNMIYKRFYQCPKCQLKIYNHSFNFQETLVKVSEKKRSR